MTKKAKLDQFDAIASELDKLRLAVYDLCGASKWPFKHHVKINCGKEIDGDYPDHVYRVSISQRSMPYYMVECYGYDGRIAQVQFWREDEIEAKRDDGGIYWHMLRYAMWKIGQQVKAA